MKKALSFLFSLPVFLFADGEAAAPATGSNFTQTLIIIGLGIVFFYVILWRPEQKRRKTAQKMREALKSGDRVTAMGIVGTVAQVLENTVILKMYDGAKLEFLKAAISEVKPPESNNANS